MDLGVKEDKCTVIFLPSHSFEYAFLEGAVTGSVPSSSQILQIRTSLARGWTRVCQAVTSVSDHVTWVPDTGAQVWTLVTMHGTDHAQGVGRELSQASPIVPEKTITNSCAQSSAQLSL